MAIDRPIPSFEEALPGRENPLRISGVHWVNQHSMVPPWPQGMEEIVVGLGCFWGAERLFWQLPGVYVTAVGYAGGTTPIPTYEEVCSGLTGHAEVVQVIHDPERVSLRDILRIFWESHDPTQGMRQGNDVGSQYRSVIYVTNDSQLHQAEESRQHYAKALAQAGKGEVTTEIAPLDHFYLAEEFHQQYLAKNPNGYCGLKGTGISCAMG